MKQNLDAIKTLNGSHSSTGFNTIPNESDVAWYISQIRGLNLNGFESEVLNNTSQGFDKFCVLLYRQFANFVSSQWEYNDAFLKALATVSEGVDKYLIDGKLLENGSLALIKINDDYFLMPYTALVVDVYQHPVKIKTIYSQNEKSSWNQRTFSKEDFVILKNDSTSFNLLLKQLPSVQLMYRSLCQLWENLYSSLTHFLQLTDPSFDVDVDKNGSQAVADLITGRKTFITYSPKDNGNVGAQSQISASLNATSVEKWKNSIIQIEQPDMISSYQQAYRDAQQDLNAMMGISTNFNVDKKERDNATAISIQQDIPEANKTAMFNSRKFGLDMANKKWGTSFSVEWIETEDDEYDDNEQNETNNINSID